MTQAQAPLTASIAILSLAAIPAHAQENLTELAEELTVTVAPAATERALDAEIPDITMLAARSDTGDSAFGDAPTQLQFQSGIDGDNVQLTLARDFQRNSDLQRLGLSLTLNAPLDKDAGFGTFITDTGLPNAYSVKASVSFSLFAPKPPEVDQSFLQRLITRNGEQLQALCEQQPEDTSTTDCNGSLSPVALLGQLHRDPMQNLISQQMLEEMKEEPYLRWTLSGAVGRKKYGFRDPVGFAEMGESETLFSLSSSFYYLPQSGGDVSLIAGAEIERDYELPSAEIRCPLAAPGDTSVTCLEASFGPPKRSTESTLFSAVRYSANIGEDDFPIALELRFAVNPEDGEWGVQAPIYFLRSKPSTKTSRPNLNGGIRIGYESDDDDFFFGIFVGSNFSLSGD